VDNVLVSRDDIDALAQAVEDGTLPAQELLRSLVTAIQSAAEDEESIQVSVEVAERGFGGEDLPETFDAAFVPDADPVGGRVRVTVAKIGR
jgi:hypothetical protein